MPAHDNVTVLRATEDLILAVRQCNLDDAVKRYGLFPDGSSTDVAKPPGSMSPSCPATF